MKPETRYAKCGDVHIAWQVAGTGPFDLVVIPGWVSHLDYAWEEPFVAGFLRRLASFSRLILLDRRGTGLSDRVPRVPTLEERMDDVRAVLDAAGSERPAFFGISEGGPMSLVFAASHPERTRALVLFGTYASLIRREGFPQGIDRSLVDAFIEHVTGAWGEGRSVDVFAPGLAADAAFRARWAKFERMAVSPGSARILLQTAIETDVRAILGSVQAPALVLHRAGDVAVPASCGRHLAGRLPSARYVELPGADHFPWVGDTEAVLGEVEEFLTGARSAGATERVLATVLFADLVDSTALAARLGDRGWGELLRAFHQRARTEVERFGGTEIDTAGDGYFAAFDGPARAVRCADRLRRAMAELGVEVRQGIHTGECERNGTKLAGLAVHVGARVCALAGPGEVLASSTVRDLTVGSTLRFTERGEHELKGVPGTWRLFAAGVD
jgi:class 3 adenylate cyclase